MIKSSKILQSKLLIYHIRFEYFINETLFANNLSII